MAFTNSPLRYPGGKSALARLMTEIIASNNLRSCTYAEPFAGGCGLALRLLFDGVVADIAINDLDPTIWAFWHSVLCETDELSRRVELAEVTIEQWHSQRRTLLEADLSDPVALGYAAFFLNRTNRSGIIRSGGVIGGLDQRGAYKIDCRFNRIELAARIRRIGSYRDRISLSRLDAVDFLDQFEADGPEGAFICIDPPYFNQGSSLYANYYQAAEHAVLAERVLRLKCPWVVTYDDAAPIRELFSSCPIYRFGINYSAQRKRVGTELLIHKASLNMTAQTHFGLHAV